MRFLFVCLLFTTEDSAGWSGDSCPDVTGSALSPITLSCFRAGHDAFFFFFFYTAEDGAVCASDS